MGYKTVNKSNLPMIDYRELVPLQGNLKDLTKANYQKLLKSIEKEGFFVPAFVWFNDGVPYILDAHQRHRVLTNENIEFENSGFEIPYIEIEAIILPTRFRASVKEVGWMLKQCLNGWKSGEAHNWYSDRKQTTVLEFDRPSRNAEHPTMKPINILAYLIQNSSKGGDLVYDSFLGSGSTLIASEQTGRLCYGTELDPSYVDVCRKRYAKFISPDNELPENWEELTPAIARGKHDGKS